MRDFVETQQINGEGRADESGDGGGGHKASDGAGALRARKPVGEIEDDAREESGLGCSQEEAEEIETGGRIDEGHAGRYDSPGNHDDGDPATRPETQENEVGRDFEESVADEEKSSANAVNRAREAELPLHGKCGEAEIHAVKIRTDIEQEEKWNEPPKDAAHDAGGVDDGGLLGIRHVRSTVPERMQGWEGQLEKQVLRLRVLRSRRQSCGNCTQSKDDKAISSG